MKKLVFTEEQVNGLLDLINRLRKENEVIRAEVEMLRVLLTAATLQHSSPVQS
jgi:hypothetical protein